MIVPTICQRRESEAVRNKNEGVIAVKSDGVSE